MFQAIPLASTLRVDVQLVVECTEIRCHINYLLLELLPPEAGELDIVERPVELDVLAGRDLATCGFDDILREEVDCCSRYGLVLDPEGGRNRMQKILWTPRGEAIMSAARMGHLSGSSNDLQPISSFLPPLS